MAGAGFRWTPLRASRERRQWLRAAALLSAALALTLVGALWAQPDGVRALAAAAAMLSAVWAAVASGRAQTPTPFALHIDAEGAIWGRIEGGADRAPMLRLRPCLVTSRLVTLAGGGLTVAVWRDALPHTEFRRLCVHARWHLERGGPAADPDRAAAADAG